MPHPAEDERIPKAFTSRLWELHGKRFDAAGACIQISAKALQLGAADNLQRITGFFLASMTNSIAALGVLCRYGHGADAIRIARGMFEILVSLKYLIARPAEVMDYLDFDCVARWKRMQYYKTNRPQLYAEFPATKKAEVGQEYERVRTRFLGANGKPRPTWCKHSIAQMAVIAELTELYELFYPYASAIHHASPMGLGMLVEGGSLELKPAPQLAHIGIALMLAVRLLAEAIRSQSKLHNVDFDAVLKVAEDAADQDITLQDGIGSLAEIFPGVS